jgi:hypothetical protein
MFTAVVILILCDLKTMIFPQMTGFERADICVPNANPFYDVPLNELFSQSLTKNRGLPHQCCIQQINQTLVMGLFQSSMGTMGWSTN